MNDIIAVLDLLGEPGITPHPALVAATVPTARDFLMAVSVTGWLPDAPLFPIALVNRTEET